MANQVQTVTKYEAGTNALLDAIYEESDGPVWVVQGTNGRMPILAPNEEEARQQYLSKKYVSIGSLDRMD